MLCTCSAHEMAAREKELADKANNAIAMKWPRWRPFAGGKGIMGLFEEASDHVGHHVGLLCFRCWVGAIKDCNDGNEGNRIGKCELRVLGAFGDSSESVGSCNGNGGFGRLFRV
jgi:hypothetical protein